jgi:hypothetical protein
MRIFTRKKQHDSLAHAQLASKNHKKNSFLSTAPRRTADYSDLNIWQVHVPSCNKKAATTKFHLSNSSLSAHPLKRGTPTPFMQSLSPLSFFQMSHTSQKLLLALLLLHILIFHLFLVGFCFELFTRLRKKQSWSHQLLQRWANAWFEQSTRI